MSIKIYVMAHKKFELPPLSYLVPLQVGSEGKEDFGYLRDNNGENISIKNPNYCELTGIYWIWKNAVDAEYVGLCHYRRYFATETGQFAPEEDLLEGLRAADVIVSKRVESEHTMWQEYADTHYERDMEITRDVINEFCPEYEGAFQNVMQGHAMYTGNIMLCRKELFDRYCEWLFGILLEVEKRVDLTEYNQYQKRIFGFISERLLMVYFEHHKEYKVLEKRVGVLGAKVEKEELYQKISGYLKENQRKEAEAYYKQRMEERPDLLNDLNDLDMNILMIRHIFKIFEIEKKLTVAGKKLLGNPFQDYSSDIKELIQHYSNILGLLIQAGNGQQRELLQAYLVQKRVSPAAVCHILHNGSLDAVTQVRILNEAAVLLFQAGCPQKAIWLEEEAVRMSPDNQALRDNLGLMKQQGNLQE